MKMIKNIDRVLQIFSIIIMWIFVAAIDIWILSLVFVARELKDALNASVVIGIMAIVLFLCIASILTYVFIGLQRNQHDSDRLADT